MVIVVVAMLNISWFLRKQMRTFVTGLFCPFWPCLRRSAKIPFGKGNVNKNPLYGGYFFTNHHILCFYRIQQHIGRLSFFLVFEQVLLIFGRNLSRRKPQFFFDLRQAMSSTWFGVPAVCLARVGGCQQHGFPPSIPASSSL